VKLEEKKKAEDEEKKIAETPVVIEKPKKKFEKTKEAPDSQNDSTLFVRNIAWDVTQEGFKEHMLQFGEVTYAVLCKAAGDMKVA
jgi:RNA recognition motif-containing protein